MMIKSSEKLYTFEQKVVWWGDGEWAREPDLLELEYEGYQCRIIRQAHLDGKEQQYMFGGFLCGYVSIPLNHPFYKKPYEDIPVDCHGGLTFGEGKKDYWIGFDCAHSFDYVPSTEHLKKTCDWLKPWAKPIKESHEKLKKNYPKIFERTYKNIEFCCDQCEEIIDQLKLLEIEKNA
jgi:hypothetical protein